MGKARDRWAHSWWPVWPALDTKTSHTAPSVRRGVQSHLSGVSRQSLTTNKHLYLGGSRLCRPADDAVRGWGWPHLLQWRQWRPAGVLQSHRHELVPGEGMTGACVYQETHLNKTDRNRQFRPLSLWPPHPSCVHQGGWLQGLGREDHHGQWGLVKRKVHPLRPKAIKTLIDDDILFIHA